MITPLVQRQEAPEEEELQAKPLVQRQEAPAEEELQAKPLVQRQEAPAEEELQAKPLVQRQEAPEEEELQAKPLVQRQEAPEEEELQAKPLVQRQEAPEEEELQAKRSPQESEASHNDASENLENQLNSSKGGGSPLPDEVRSFMEPRFGADFSQVRVHTDSQAVQMNQAVGAQAFTHGSDIYFGAGKSPGISDLTAHELTHVVQQTGAVQTKLTLDQPTVQRKKPQEEENASYAEPMVSQVDLGSQPSTDTSTEEVKASYPEPAVSEPDAGAVQNQWYAPQQGSDPQGSNSEEVMVYDIGEKEPYNWDAAAKPAPTEILGDWAGNPAYPEVAISASGIEAFNIAWAQAQYSWDNMKPMMQQYFSLEQEAEALTPKAAKEKIGKVFNKDAVALPDKLDTAQEVESKLAYEDIDKIADMRTAVEEAKVNAEAADVAFEDAKSKCAQEANNAEKILNDIDIATLEQEIVEKEDKKADAAMQKAAAVGAVQGVTSIIKGFLSEPGKGTGDIVSGAGKLAETAVAGGFDYHISQLNGAIVAMKGKIASIKIKSLQLTLQNQYENIAIAARALTVANEKRNLAYTKRDDAFRKLSTEVLKGAAKGGATAADQDKIRTAIMAQPIIEKLIGKINEMNSAVSLPSYTEESGRGAALATNTDDFVYHLSILKGNKTVLEDGKNTWESRLADIKQLSGV
jgi:hypothetical protein